MNENPRSNRPDPEVVADPLILLDEDRIERCTQGIRLRGVASPVLRVNASPRAIAEEQIRPAA